MAVVQSPLQNSICRPCIIWLIRFSNRSYVLRHIRSRSFCSSCLFNIKRTIQPIVRSTSSPEMAASGDLKSSDSLLCTTLLNVKGPPFPSPPPNLHPYINRPSPQILTWEWLRTYMKSYMKYIPSNLVFIIVIMKP